MSDKISVKDAQAEINGLLVAEICRDFGINFRDVYPDHILARGVGPEQAFIGLAIKRGYLALPAVQPRAKPLVWSDFREGGCIGKPHPFQFFITQAHNGKYLCHHDTSWHDDLAAAQAHAQVAYQTSALETAVQPDAAAIREAALVKALDAAFPIVRKASVAAKMDAVNASPSDPTALRREAWMRKCDAALELVVSARALIDNTGKEVMPDEARTTRAAHDIGPGDQDAVAGAAQCCMCGKKGLSTEEDGGPECELHDKRWVCSSECYDVALEIMLKPVAGAAQYEPWPEGLIHLTNTRRFHVDSAASRICATEGCGRHVSTRFEGRDYCEPCGRKVALAQKGGA